MLAFQSDLVKRDDMFITSKLWCDDNDAADVSDALQRSLSALQLDYLDLYLMHFPLRLTKGAKIPPKESEFLPLNLKGSWQALEKCVHHGMTRAIGVSNFSACKLADLLQYADIVPAVNQVEMHPVWQQKRLRDFCSAKGIHVSAWSPLGAPGTKYGSNLVLDHPTIKEIAAKYGKSRGQVVLRWGVQNGASVLPKSYNHSHQAENLNIFDWELGEEDMQAISTIEQRRTIWCEYFCNKSTSPFKTVDELWDTDL